jgi:cytochrome c6
MIQKGNCSPSPQKNSQKQKIPQKLIMLKRFVSIALTCLLLWSSRLPASLAADLPNGARLFEIHCAGCHINGGNIVRRGKTLKLKALQRNQVDSEDAIARLVTQGKANMPAYGDRLNQAEIQAVAAYVLKQAQGDWH